MKSPPTPGGARNLLAFGRNKTEGSSLRVPISLDSAILSSQKRCLHDKISPDAGPAANFSGRGLNSKRKRLQDTTSPDAEGAAKRAASNSSMTNVGVLHEKISTDAGGAADFSVGDLHSTKTEHLHATIPPADLNHTTI